MANKLVVGNMKMNLSYDEVEEYIDRMQGYQDCIICPSYIYVPYFIDSGFTTGVQDVASYDNGAYTGEVSAKQLASLGVKYTIIGHSERRELFNDTDALIKEKIIKALTNNLKVILCVGETLTERENNQAKKKIADQLLTDLKDIDNINDDNLIIAYEPIWAIGTGKVPSNDDIDEIISYIKELTNKEYHINPKVLYGGSTNDANIKELAQIKSVDGFLVGGACLVPDKFIKIIEAVR